MLPKTISHLAYATALQDLTYSINCTKPGGIVWVIGPSGAGKSHIRSEVARVLVGDPSQWGDGRLPLVSVRAQVTDRSRFNPKDLARRLADSLREPNLDFLRLNVSGTQLESIESYLSSVSSSHKFLGRRDSSEHAMRSEFERHARARDLKWLFIEEIASIVKVHRGHSVANYMTSLMQIAEEIGVVLVLFGTQRAFPLWMENEEVRNRSRWVWVRRYREYEPEDLRPFAEMVRAAGARYELSRKDLLTSDLELALVNSAGIMGSLLNWLDRADAHRNIRRADKVELCDLRKATLEVYLQEDLWNKARAFDEIADAKGNFKLSALVKNVSWRGGD
ncbi:AAA family ATPase [Luteimonas terrae]|uniref:AAA family ATPase n=1 Tax=Luteimonas terrae TaxID=1530191 RepID=UPI0014045A55|nr:AAA family ATPase [Luteimonas terrae]